MNFRFLSAKRLLLTESYLKIFFRFFIYVLLPYRSFSTLISIGKVASGSMTPTILTHDLVVMSPYAIRVADVLKILLIFMDDFLKPHTYLMRKFPILSKKLIEFKQIEVGDVVTFMQPGRIEAYTKRVIAKEGDKIQMYYGAIFINDKPLKYTYKGTMEAFENNKTIYGDIWQETNNNKTYDTVYLHGMGREQDCSDILYVPDKSFVVFGDNRHDSADTRSLVSFVHQDEVIYRVVFNILSNSNITTLHLYEIMRSMRKEYMLRLV